MEFITIEQFQNYCKVKKCLRHTMITKQCTKEHKQINCYNKYIKKNLDKLTTTNKYDDEKEFRQKIIDRDKTCRIWDILNQEERNFILKNFYDDYIINNELDICHIVPRSEAPQLKYEESNVFLGARYFHSLLDTYRHPITKEHITKEQRLKWCYNALKGIRDEY
jgi:hypothetical protein